MSQSGSFLPLFPRRKSRIFTRESLDELIYRNRASWRIKLRVGVLISAAESDSSTCLIRFNSLCGSSHHLRGRVYAFTHMSSPISIVFAFALLLRDPSRATRLVYLPDVYTSRSTPMTRWPQKYESYCMYAMSQNPCGRRTSFSMCNSSCCTSSSRESQSP